MEEQSKYWKFVRINSAGEVRVGTMVAAQNYFQQRFSNLDDNLITDAAIVRQLWQQVDLKKSSPAQLCLRCYISKLVYWVCFDLAKNFGCDKGFTCGDLLPFVLDDEVLLKSRNSYQSLATRILQTFDPDKGSLKTWVIRYVKQHPEIHRFLLENGIFIISDWAILNDTNRQELQRIFTQMYQSATVEIQQSIELLISYHAVYREDRIQQRLKGKTLPCKQPTPEQLKRIIDDFQSRNSNISRLELTNEIVLNQLQSIAAKLRKYRIAVRGGSVSTVSMYQPEIQNVAEKKLQLQTDTNTEQIEFIKQYQKQFITSLDLAISQVVEEFISRSQRRRSFNQEAFTQGLELFHCQGLSMSQIAPEIGLKKQYEVTRLLRLNDLRADIRQKLLIILSQRVIDIAKNFSNTQKLQNLDNKIQFILEEQISTIIQEAESEVKNPVRNQPLKNLIARRICHYLDRLKVKG
ncbi:MAG: hypothetical protein AAFQ91_32330 [Cyanobacteria bacterium J06621_15]